MKKKLVLLLATLMCISLCACGGSENTSTTEKKDTYTDALTGETVEVEVTEETVQVYGIVTHIEPMSAKDESQGNLVVFTCKTEEFTIYPKILNCMEEIPMDTKALLTIEAPIDSINNPNPVIISWEIVEE